MALKLDSSSPARFTGTPANDVDIWSQAFRPPPGALIVAHVSADTNGSADNITVSVSGGGLTWTNQVERDPGSTGVAGHASIWTAPDAVNTSPMMVLVRRTAGDGSTKRISVKVEVWTGVHTTDPIGNSGGGSETTTNNITPNAYTSSANNSRGVGCATDWNQLGLPTSTDDEDADDYTGAISVISLHKAADTPTSGSTVTMNFDAAGAGAPNWNWVALEILPDPSPPTPGGYILLENGTDRILLEDGSGLLILEETEVVGVALEAVAAGKTAVRSAIDIAVGLTSRTVGRASVRNAANVAVSIASRAVGSVRAMAASSIARSLDARSSAGARTRAAANIVRDLTARTIGSARTLAGAIVARALNAGAIGRTSVLNALADAGSMAARISAGAYVVGSMVVSRVMDARITGQTSTRAGQSVVYALSAITHSRAVTQAGAVAARALSAVTRAGGSVVAGAHVSRALSAVISLGAAVRANLPPLFVEVVGIIRVLLRASMQLFGLKASMRRVVITAQAETETVLTVTQPPPITVSAKIRLPIVVSANNMIPTHVTLRDYVIGDDTEIAFELTEWPAGVLLAKAYLTIKSSLADLDAAAVVQRDITTTLTAEGRITADGSTGTATGFFLIRHQDAEWANVKPSVYEFDIQSITNQATLQTPITGTISFKKGATDATS